MLQASCNDTGRGKRIYIEFVRFESQVYRMAGDPRGQYAALIAFAQNEATSLAKVFQTALTYSLAFRATSAIDSSADNIVIMVREHLRVLCWGGGSLRVPLR